MRTLKPSARYPLSLVRRLRVHVMGGRALLAVFEHFKKLLRPITEQRAVDIVTEIVQDLTPAEFVESKELVAYELEPVVADVYGVRNAHGDWYVKLYVRDDRVWVPSCHPPEGTMIRADGLRIGKPRK